MIIETLLFIFFWFTICGVWHETMHVLEAERQHCVTSSMWVSFDSFVFYKKLKLPSMHYVAHGAKNNRLVRCAGGIYTSGLSALLSIIFSIYGQTYLAWVFLTLSLVQFFYGIYEGFYSVKYRYLIYISVVLIMCVVKYYV